MSFTFILALLVGCSSDPYKEAKQYLESEESWEKVDENLYQLHHDDEVNKIRWDYEINFDEKTITCVVAYSNEDKKHFSYNWETKEGRVEDLDQEETCILVTKQDNRAYVKDKCDCVARFPSKDDYKMANGNLDWPSIENVVIDLFINTPMNPYKLK